MHDGRAKACGRIDGTLAAMDIVRNKTKSREVCMAVVAIERRNSGKRAGHLPLSAAAPKAGVAGLVISVAAIAITADANAQTVEPGATFFKG